MSSRMLARVLAAVSSVVLPLALASSAMSQDPLPWRDHAAASDPYAADSYSGSGDAYRTPAGGGYAGSGDAYRPPSGDSYSGSGDTYRPGRAYETRDDSFSDPPQGGGGYGEPYRPPSANPNDRYDGAPQSPHHYEQNEIVAAGHGFFGAVSRGLAGAVEYAFKSQGRPNGYILGEDAGGALVVGLRYGEGTLYTKDAGDHKVFWQGPSVGYDAGAEGSKTMVLVYNLMDPGEIYGRFGGAEGTAYLVGGVSVQFQTAGHVTLAVIRSGVGLRLGANVGYLKYTRSPTWNPL